MIINRTYHDYYDHDNNDHDNNDDDNGFVECPFAISISIMDDSPFINSSYPKYISFLKSFVQASFSRYRGIQQFFISHSIPAVSLHMHTRPATLQERTSAARTDQLHTLLKGLKSVVESAGSAESRINRNYVTYIPLFGVTPRIVVRDDVLLPTLMLLASFTCLAFSVVCE